MFDWFVLGMRMQVILDFPGLTPGLSFRPPPPPGSAPIGGGKKGELRDWTISTLKPVREWALIVETMYQTPPTFLSNMAANVCCVIVVQVE